MLEADGGLMDRRTFLACAGAVPFVRAGRAQADAGRLLVVIDLLGGNDGLGAVMPWADPLYYRLRPTIAPDRRTALPLDEATALHPSLRAVLPLWQAGELAVVQGVGSVDAGLSHARAREVTGGGVSGDQASRPLSGVGDGLPLPAPDAIERDAMCRRFGFPEGELGSALAGACAALADGSVVSVVQVTLDGFDTHENQPAIHGALLAELAGSLAALRDVLRALGRWDDTLVMTRSEFGRRAAENLTAGTDHGCAGVQFLAGGRVAGGLHGAAPRLDALDERGGLRPTVDARTLNAGAARYWLGESAGAGLASPGGLFRA
jgi:uncharacterized protein (DUF1501 family)